MQRIACIATVLGFAASAIASPDPRYAATIRKAAADYTKWGKVDDTSRIAPTLCASPLPAKPSHARMSAAEDDSPHGKKLFYLWATNRDAYANLRRSKLAIPVGFTIVKQSFAAVGDASSGYTTGAKKDLFVMTKLGDKPGTDDGWIYGTVTPDGVVTSAGRVETCMHCHDDQATHERLFGIADL
jgi:hypothetical protein